MKTANHQSSSMQPAMASSLLNPPSLTKTFHFYSVLRITHRNSYPSVTQYPASKPYSCSLHPNIHRTKLVVASNFSPPKQGTVSLQNRKYGLSLLSCTVKITSFVAALGANPTLVSGFVAWAFAQSSKVVLSFLVYRKWDLKLMCSSGGMPSSHSALCTALTTSVGICQGVADSLFAVCLGFTLIVMYDAIGVRRHAGMQAQVLNMIVEDLFQGHPISQRKLEELLGHTPLQVMAGALLGIVVACFCCQRCLVAT